MYNNVNDGTKAYETFKQFLEQFPSVDLSDRTLKNYIKISTIFKQLKFVSII